MNFGDTALKLLFEIAPSDDQVEVTGDQIEDIAPDLTFKTGLTKKEKWIEDFFKQENLNKNINSAIQYCFQNEQFQKEFLNNLFEYIRKNVRYNFSKDYKFSDDKYIKERIYTFKSEIFNVLKELA